ncbi:signal peptidase II [Lachnospiraceae bacterium OttesenSCG-928-D06]|nr:signal peptidase II [Lachnospiraceae bacterium OttesenSCG-928-D06]
MILFCVGLVALIFFTDYRIKNHIEEEYVEGEIREIFGGKLLIRKHHNKGAMLNLGQSKRKVVAALSVVLTIITLLVFMISFGKRGNTMMRVGLSFLLGGAFSNTYDRLKRKYVVDYVSFPVKWERLRNVVFNLADFCIMIGALCSLLAG